MFVGEIFLQKHILAISFHLGALTPDKEAESSELSVPAYQAEYDIDTEVPVDDPASDEAVAKVEEQKLLAAQSEKANLPDTSVSDTAAQSEPVQPKETAVVEETPAPEESVATPVGEMVWLSATGEKYHRINNCGRMNPNKARQITLEDAINRGYDRCSKCW